LQTKQAVSYVESFVLESKPEEKLNTHLFNPCLTNSEYLSLIIEPQVKTFNGWVDYLVQPLGYDNPVAIELKPLHKVLNGKIRINHLKAEYDSLKKTPPSDNQIIKYLRDYHYVLLTNMETVYYFNREALLEFKEFHKEPFSVFVSDLHDNPNIWDVVRKKEDITVQQKHDLGSAFFADLSRWCQKYEHLKFIPSVNNRSEKIVQLLNKFIFLKTLEDYSLIPFNYIIDTYEDKKMRWGTKGAKTMFREFFNEITKWAYAFYDTELFAGNIFDEIDHSDGNLKELQEATEDVLGISAWNKYLSFGLLSYNYRGIDEDIFGKSYETFLAVGRKEHGIYYTPAIITTYMSDMLVNLLFSELKDRLLKAVNEEPRNFDLACQLAHKINSIRIADIAGGSGSFLVKVLKSIWRIYLEFHEKTAWATQREALFDPHEVLKRNVIDIRKILGIGQESFDERKTLATAILKHLYLVDLDERAVDVAKVNIWKEAVKIAPRSFRYSEITGDIDHVLPDLELNFIVANSLVDMPLNQCLELIQKNFKKEIVQLHAIRNNYLRDPYNPDSIQEALAIKNKVRTFLLEAYSGLEYSIASPPLFAPLEFFFCYFDEYGEYLEEAQMGLSGTIGNPPYVRHESIRDFKPFLKTAYEDFYCGTGDLYTYFYNRCIALLKSEGYLCYITPNKFMRAAYGENTRNLLTSKATPMVIIDFGDLPIFEDATTYPAVFLLKKGIPKEESLASVACFTSMEQVGKIVETMGEIGFNMPVSSLKTEGWTLERADVLALMEKLKKAGKPLGEYVQRKFYRGILTGLNEAFVVGEVTRNRLITEDPKSAELIKPWLRGRDIHKWEIHWVGLYLITIESSANKEWSWSKEISEAKARLVFAETYPAIHRYLSQYEVKLRIRDDQGKFWWELRSCIYWEEFKKPKIIYPNITKTNIFSFDATGTLANQKCFIIPTTDIYLAGILNSKLATQWFHSTLPLLRGGFFEPSAIFMQYFPVFPATDVQKAAITERVQKILDNTSHPDVPTIEAEIDETVFSLYNLTSEEKN
jgi:TaqI-like C-terminal specificity domain/Eco57I restriction-modification methylase